MKNATIKSCILILILLTSCSPSRKNELVYRFIPQENAVSVDSLKTQILNTMGTEMLVMYPDSDVVIIHYDRFRTHQDIIETKFNDNGYRVVLLKKSSIDEREQPWQKK